MLFRVRFLGTAPGGREGSVVEDHVYKAHDRDVLDVFLSKIRRVVPYLDMWVKDISVFNAQEDFKEWRTVLGRGDEASNLRLVLKVPKPAPKRKGVFPKSLSSRLFDLARKMDGMKALTQVSSVIVEDTTHHHVVDSENVCTVSDALTVQTFSTGATRVPVEEAFHLVCPELERRVALICAEGLRKHLWKEMGDAELTTGDKGLPLANLLKHGRRHFNKWLRGDRTEDHLAKTAWAIMMIMHAETSIESDERMGNYECQHTKMLVKAEQQGEVR